MPWPRQASRASGEAGRPTASLGDRETGGRAALPAWVALADALDEPVGDTLSPAPEVGWTLHEGRRVLVPWSALARPIDGRSNSAGGARARVAARPSVSGSGLRTVGCVAGGPMDIVVVYVAPIPVGHRVRVTWHQRTEPGLAGQTRTDRRPHQPWITDLDTGVIYRTDWASGSSRRRRPDAPYELGAALGTDVSVERQIVGVVEDCQVVTVRGYPDLEVQTHLVVAVDGDAA